MLAQRNTKYLIKNIKQITEKISPVLFDLKWGKLKSQGKPCQTQSSKYPLLAEIIKS